MPELRSFLRSIRTVSLAEAERRSGIGKSRISDFERGNRYPTPGHLVRLAQAYGVDRMILLLYADFLQLPGFEALIQEAQEENGLDRLLQGANLEEKREMAKHLATIRMIPGRLGVPSE